MRSWDWINFADFGDAAPAVEQVCRLVAIAVDDARDIAEGIVVIGLACSSLGFDMRLPAGGGVGVACTTAASCLDFDAAARTVVGDGFEQLAIGADDCRQPAGAVILIAVRHILRQLSLRDISFFIVDNFLRAAFTGHSYNTLIHQIVRESFLAAAVVGDGQNVTGFIVCEPGGIPLPGCVIDNRFFNQPIYSIVAPLDFNAIGQANLRDVAVGVIGVVDMRPPGAFPLLIEFFGPVNQTAGFVVEEFHQLFFLAVYPAFFAGAFTNAVVSILHLCPKVVGDAKQAILLVIRIMNRARKAAGTCFALPCVPGLFLNDKSYRV